MKNNVKLTKLAKTITTLNVALITATSAISSVGAAPAAPAGADTEAYNTIVGVVFWLVWIILGGIALPGIIGIARGIADDDIRQRNSGIVATIACAAAIGVSAVIKTAVF